MTAQLQSRSFRRRRVMRLETGSLLLGSILAASAHAQLRGRMFRLRTLRGIEDRPIIYGVLSPIRRDRHLHSASSTSTCCICCGKENGIDPPVPGSRGVPHALERWACLHLGRRDMHPHRQARWWLNPCAIRSMRILIGSPPSGITPTIDTEANFVVCGPEGLNARLAPRHCGSAQSASGKVLRNEY